MSFSDAMAVTLLGMGVVFTGLVLTAMMIWSFSLPGQVRKLRDRKNEPDGAGEMVDPDIIAVITAAIEIERRIYNRGPSGTLTIVREVREEEMSG